MEVRHTSLIFVLLLIHLQAVGQIFFEKLTVDDGLSQMAVNSFVQDRRGFLWIGTRDGLNRYDGNEFVNYFNLPNERESISGNQIFKVIVDEGGDIWAITDNGISQYDFSNDNFENTYYEFLEGERRLIVNDAVISQEFLYITCLNGLYRINLTDKKSFEKIDLPQLTDPWTGPLAKNGNKVYVGTKEGIFRLGQDGKAERFIPELNNTINGILAEENQLIILNQRELLVSNYTGKVSDRREMSFSFSFPNRMVRDPSGNVWIGSGTINLLDSSYQLIKRYSSQDLETSGLSSLTVTDIFLTGDNNLWIGHNGYGINKLSFKNTGIVHIKKDRNSSVSIHSNYISSFLEIDQDNLAVGFDDGLDLIDLNQNLSQHIPLTQLNEIKNRCNDIEIGLDGILWLGTDRGLMTLDKNRKVQRVLNRYYIMDILPMGDSIFYLGTSRKGIIKFNKWTGTFKKLTAAPDLIEFRKLILFNDRMYAGTNEGLLEFDLSANALIRKYTSPGDPVEVKSLEVDEDGHLWIGTWGNGVFQLDKNGNIDNLEYINEKLTNRTIYGILFLRDNLWMTTNDGIQVFSHADSTLLHLQKNNGLQSSEFNTNAYHLGQSGRIYAGGVNGFNIITPQLILSSQKVELPVLTNISFQHGENTENYPVDSTIVFPSGTGQVRFDFSLIDFNQNGLIKYLYRLDDLNSRWIKLNEGNTISLFSLSPGSHVLQVMTTNHYGIPGNNILEIPFEVNAPFWSTLWFRILAIIMVLSIGLVIYRWRLGLLDKKNKALEMMVEQRTRDLRNKSLEIMVQNMELKQNAEEIELSNRDLRQKTAELEQLKANLEWLVEERTRSLDDSKKELELQNEKLEQFSYIISHNLRSPIGRIKGLLDLLPEEIKIQDEIYIPRIEESVVNLEEVVNDLNGILRIKKSDTSSFEAIHVASELQLVLDVLKSEIEERNVAIQLDITDNALIKGLKAYLNNIFFNLISNAVKYSNDQGGTVEISVKQIENEVQITISDDGIGIDMNYAAGKMFQLYKRFTDKRKGKGIGLYITKSQIDVMGGSISVKSSPGKGSTFTVLLPSA